MRKVSGQVKIALLARALLSQTEVLPPGPGVIGQHQETSRTTPYDIWLDPS